MFISIFKVNCYTISLTELDGAVNTNAVDFYSHIWSGHDLGILIPWP